MHADYQLPSMLLRILPFCIIIDFLKVLDLMKLSYSYVDGGGNGNSAASIERPWLFRFFSRYFS